MWFIVLEAGESKIQEPHLGGGSGLLALYGMVDGIRWREGMQEKGRGQKSSFYRITHTHDN